MKHLTSGDWWIASKTDPRWNANGRSEMVGGFVMCEEAKAAVELKKSELGEMPDDLEHGYMKDSCLSA